MKTWHLAVAVLLSCFCLAAAPTKSKLLTHGDWESIPDAGFRGSVCVGRKGVKTPCVKFQTDRWEDIPAKGEAEWLKANK